jgi:hypothetical protein
MQESLAQHFFRGDLPARRLWWSGRLHGGVPAGNALEQLLVGRKYVRRAHQGERRGGESSRSDSTMHVGVETSRLILVPGAPPASSEPWPKRSVPACMTSEMCSPHEPRTGQRNAGFETGCITQHVSGKALASLCGACGVPRARELGRSRSQKHCRKRLSWRGRLVDDKGRAGRSLQTGRPTIQHADGARKRKRVVVHSAAQVPWRQGAILIRARPVGVWFCAAIS